MYYDTKAVKEATLNAAAVDAVVQRIYPEAELDPREDVWKVAHPRGGAGKSCIFNRSGPYAGHFHDFGDAGAETHGDLIDAVKLARDCDHIDAVNFLGDLLGVQKSRQPAKMFASRKEPALPNGNVPLSTLKDYQSRLQAAPPALTYLEGRGLTRKTIDYFKLGVMAPYKREGLLTGPSILVPVLNAQGHFEKPFPKVAVPGFTQNAPAKDWCSGSPRTYWAAPRRDQTTLFICEGMKDLWMVWQTIADSSLGVRMAVITSTHGSNIPAEWRDPKFWSQFDRIYLGHDNDAAGEKTANAVKKLAAREFCRVEVPRKLGKDWTDFFKTKSLVDFEDLLERAKPEISPIIGMGDDTDSVVDLNGEPDGMYAAKPINVNGSYHRGQMYYPYRVRVASTQRVKVEDDDGKLVEVDQTLHSYQTMVMRSDGTSLAIQMLPAPPGTPIEDRIIVLSDGTMIVHQPRPTTQATWSLASIQHYQKCMIEGRAPHRPLKHLLRDVMDYIKRCAWLTGEEEYALISAYVLMSHCFTVFDAIPLMLINGEKGTGKSTTGEAIADLAFNGVVMGSTASEKGIIRHVDEARGLIVLDDLEKVGRRPGREEHGYEDFNQFLKLSYSKSGGRKVVTEISGKTRVLDFYGPKVVTNISGIDDVNATRMFTITTRKMPRDVQAAGRVTGRDITVSEPLRQELHCWGMANAQIVYKSYKQQLSYLSDRAAQIAAPLLSIINLAGDEELSALLNTALLKQSIAKSEVEMDALGLLKMALSELIARGSTEVSGPDIDAELRKIPEARFGEHNQPEDLKCLSDSRWVSATLLKIGAREAGEGIRKRVNGVQMRFHKLRQDYITEALEERAENGLYTPSGNLRH